MDHFFFCQKNTFGISFNVSMLAFCSLCISEHRRSVCCLPSQRVFSLSIEFYVGSHFLFVIEVYCSFVFGFSLFLWVIICNFCCFPFEGSLSLFFSTLSFFLWRVAGRALRFSSFTMMCLHMALFVFYYLWLDTFYQLKKTQP